MRENEREREKEKETEGEIYREKAEEIIKTYTRMCDSI